MKNTENNQSQCELSAFLLKEQTTAIQLCESLQKASHIYLSVALKERHDPVCYLDHMERLQNLVSFLIRYHYQKQNDGDS